jgi:hypothetical protein
VLLRRVILLGTRKKVFFPPPTAFAMETCVLIPQEFSLVLTAGPAPAVPAASPAVDRNANKLPEMRVNVWTNARIPQGTLIYPFQGTIRLDKLEVYNYLDDNDVSRPTTISLFIFAAILRLFVDLMVWQVEGFCHPVSEVQWSQSVPEYSELNSVCW